MGGARQSRCEGRVMEDTAMFANTQVATARVIHTPSAFSRESLLHLQEAGMLRALAPHVSRRENLPSYLCFLVTAGAGSLSYGGRTYDLEAGDCVFLDCRRGYAQSTSAHRDGSGSYDALWSLRWAHFDGPTMAGIYEKYQERGGQPVFSCTPHRQTRYEELLRSLLTLASSDSYVRDMEIAARLTELLTCLMEDAWKPEPERNGSAKRLSLTRVRSYIGEHYGEKLSLESLSQRFFINKYYLARIFREQYGCTVNTCIAQTRIGKAKELLRFTDKTVEEIGQDCGFPDANYFARSFKKSRALPQRTTADSGKCRTRKLSAIQKHPGAGAHRLCIRSRDVFDSLRRRL